MFEIAADGVARLAKILDMREQEAGGGRIGDGDRYVGQSPLAGEIYVKTATS